MILSGNWHRQPLPERPSNLDEALARGYDPHAPTHDHITPEPLDEPWAQMVDAALMNAEHRRDDDLGDPMCGERCDDCGERMCAVYGPEPRACAVTCCDCPCDCETCLHVREDMRADLLHQIAKEEGL